MSALTEADHLAFFEKTQTRMGLTMDDLSHEGPLNTADFDGVLHLSSIAERTHLTPVTVQCDDIAEMNAKFGTPDAHYEDGLLSDRLYRYPEAFDPARFEVLTACKSRCDLEYHCTDDEMRRIINAGAAYLQGYSGRVKAYEPLINKFFFPSSTSVFPINGPVTVNTGDIAVLSSDDPTHQIVTNNTTITVYLGGQVQVKSPAHINASLVDAPDRPST